MNQHSVPLPDKQFFKIGEVARLADVKPYVLRYWERVFPQLRPQKNRSNQRIFSRKDAEMVLYIKDLLHNQRFTIQGALLALDQDKSPQKVADNQQARPEILQSVSGDQHGRITPPSSQETPALQDRLNRNLAQSERLQEEISLLKDRCEQLQRKADHVDDLTRRLIQAQEALAEARRLASPLVKLRV